jgi:hypothetical protein
MKEAELDTFIDAMMEMRQARDAVVDYAAGRYGQAQIAGIDLGTDMVAAIMKDTDNWNKMWPEFPISNTDIQHKAVEKRDQAMQTLGQRIKKNMSKVIKNSPAFAPSPQDMQNDSGLPYEFADPNGGG